MHAKTVMVSCAMVLGACVTAPAGDTEAGAPAPGFCASTEDAAAVGEFMTKRPGIPLAIPSRNLEIPEAVVASALSTEDAVGVMATPEVDIRLETIRHDACWKFHRDHVPARLLTTYRGPGTEWVHPRDGAAALSEQKSFRGRIERFPEHSVGLFKGSRGGSRAGIVHRSPPVALSGEVRLFLCLNLPSIMSPSSWLSTD